MKTNLNLDFTPLASLKSSSLWAWVSKHQLNALHIPSTHHGQGLPIATTASVIRSMSSINPGHALSYLAHNVLCIDSLYRFGTSYQHKQYLDALIKGEKVGCLALTEPSFGSDALSMKTLATPTDGGYLLSGHKQWITNAPLADIAIVYAQSQTSSSPNLAAFIIDLHADNIEIKPAIDKIGMQSSTTGEIRFNNAFVPHSAALNPTGDARKMLFDCLDRERLFLSAGPLGIMDAVFQDLTRYLSMRTQFNQSLSQQPVIKNKLGELAIEYLSAQALHEQGMTMLNNKTLSPEFACAILEKTSQAAVELCDQAIHLSGGNGYTHAMRFAMFANDARLYTIGGGSSEIRKMIIASQILKTHRSQHDYA